MLGLVGLRGAGQEQVGRALFGLAEIDAGTVTLCRRPARSRTVRVTAMRAGIGLVAGDRTAESLAMALSVRENLFLNPAANGRRALDWRRPSVELRHARVLCGQFGVRPSDPTRPAETLSGGNQQKVVIARWLEIAKKLLILEEPTAGRRRGRQGRDLCPAGRRPRAWPRHPGDRHRLRGGGQHLPPRPGVQPRPGGRRDRPGRAFGRGDPPRRLGRQRRTAERVVAHA